MRKSIVAGNWKMHKNAAQTEELLNELVSSLLYDNLNDQGEKYFPFVGLIFNFIFFRLFFFLCINSWFLNFSLFCI